VLGHHLAPAIGAVAAVAAAGVYLHWPENAAVLPLASGSQFEASLGVRVTRFGTRAATPPATVTAGRASGIRVVDGDTVDAIVQPSREWRRFRLIGFDTPETYYAGCDAERQVGYSAARRLEQLVRTGQVQLEVREGARDRYSRGLATLRVDGVDVGQVLIREGLAGPYSDRGKRIDWCAKLAGK
jgi:endonuclease YncB( thermonuclease family)